MFQRALRTFQASLKILKVREDIPEVPEEVLGVLE